MKTLVLLLSAFVLAGAEDNPLAKTSLGALRGTWANSRSGRKYAEFKGIPYAKPPIGKLRLQAPQRAEPWEGTKDAFQDGPLCIQTVPYNSEGPNDKTFLLGQEDCLYLSVYTHNTTGSSPVVVHIHGGAFVWGNSIYYRPTFMMDEDVVVVNVNYRLGILGFLTFETEELRGNQGLKDQNLALKWVKENIAAFGGDPNLVTIIGESAGAASVYYHVISPMSKGLFHRAITESGTSYGRWALSVPGGAKARAEKLMGLIGCPTTPKEAIPCILAKDAKEIVPKFWDFLEFQIDPLNNFIPSLEPPGDDAFITGPTKDWSPSPVPIMMGVTSAEGLYRTLMFLGVNGTNLNWLSEKFDELAPNSLLYKESSPNPNQITKELREFYKLKDITIKDWKNLTMIYSDSWIYVPVIDGANVHKGDVYFYYWDYVVKDHVAWNPDPEDPSLVIGANHCIEASFIWDMDNLFRLNKETKATEEEIALSKNIVKIVAEFAKKGSPGPVPGNKEWKKWTNPDHFYMEIDRAGAFNLKKGLAEDRYNFWKSLDYRSNYDKAFK